MQFICPERVAGKHGNCDGTALDHEIDEVVACGCPVWHDTGGSPTDVPAEPRARADAAKLDLDAIEARAKEATPGPWVAHGFEGAVRAASTQDVIVDGITMWAETDAQYIAGMDPTTTLALVAEVRAVRAHRDNLAAMIQPPTDVPAEPRADEPAGDAGEVSVTLVADVSRFTEALDGFMDPPAAKVQRARALSDRLRASSDHRVQECGAFIGEALDGTLDEGELSTFLRGRP